MIFLKRSFTMKKLIVIVASCVLGLPAVARAQHAGDIYLGIEEQRMVTGKINPDQTITTPIRVFTATFGDSGCNPFTSNPGFDTLLGTFQPGTSIGWNAVDGIKVWNGNGFDVVDTEFFDISFASQSFIVSTGPAVGFAIAVQSDGGFHKHLNFCMNGCPNGCNLPAGADPGIYLLSLEVYSTATGVQTSDPFWIVFNYQNNIAEQQAAATWVHENLEQPATCAADVAGNDGVVNVSDLFILLAAWNTNGPGASLAAPTNIVDVSDLFVLLSQWGDCPD
jgi:hypothetical protein